MSEHYTIFRSSRAKYMRLSLSPAGEVTLVLPNFVPELVGRRFAAHHWEWVEKQRKKLPPTIEIYTQKNFVSGTPLVFFDKEKYRLKITPRAKHYDTVVLKANQLEIFLARKTTNQPERIKTLIEKFYRDQARTYLNSRAQYWAEKLGEKFNDIRIKNTTSRWGSCSTQKNLNFNWRIMLAPPEVVDYLVIHEVCHLREMNHSPAFWALVARFDPDFKTHQQWLKAHQTRLFRFLN